MSTAQSVYSKVFVGNLSFKTKANELAEYFSEAGKVVSANIITRGSRSLGYGFVEMVNDEAARKSVTQLNKKKVDGREINVEVARPRDEAKIAERRAENDRNRKEGLFPQRNNFHRGQSRGGSRGPRGGDSRGPREGDSNVQSRGGNPRAQSRGGNPRIPQNGDSRAAQVINNTGATSPSTPFNAEGAPTSDRPARRRNNKKRGPRREVGAQAASGNSTAATTTSANTSPSTPSSRNPQSPIKRHRKRAPRHTGERTPSVTTLFVANVPYALNNEEFTEIFKETSPVNAHIVEGRNGRSKGFGFVEYADESAQKAAFEKLSNADLVSKERKLAVRIALNPHVAPSTDAAPASEETPSSDTTTPTPTPITTSVPATATTADDESTPAPDQASTPGTA